MHHAGHESRLPPRSNHHKKNKHNFSPSCLVLVNARARANDDQNERFAVNSSFPLDPNLQAQELSANGIFSLLYRHMSYLS